MFSFAMPGMIVLMLVPLFLRMFAKADPADAPRVRFYNIARLKAAFTASVTRSRTRGVLSFMLLSLSWCAFSVALMQPQMVNQYSYVKSKGYDLMLAVDLSASMRALDYSTDDKQLTRLDVIKLVVREFIAKRKGDRIGLVFFGDSAYLQSPLTQDGGAVISFLDRAVTGLAGNATAIGESLGLAVKSLRERPENSRVIILLTDGENTAGTIMPMDAARLAKDYGIRVYTIGVGTSKRVPYLSENGQIIQNVSIPFDDSLLKQIADETGGAYFYAADKKALENIYAKIDALEKSEAESREYLISTPLYRYPLALGVLLLMLSFLLPVLLGRKGAYGTR